MPHYLLRHGFSTFSPMLLARNTKHHIVRAPLFAGYLFVRFDARVPGWHVVTRAIGVSYLLAGPDGMPRPVPAQVMTRMLAEPEVAAPDIVAPDIVVPDARAPEARPVKQMWRSLAEMTQQERQALLSRWLEDEAA